MHSQFGKIFELVNVSLVIVIIIKMQGLEFAIFNGFDQFLDLKF